MNRTMTEEERLARIDLAAFYRIVAGYGWDDLLLAHLSCRVPGEEAYLINPYGMLFSEITASRLLKVDYDGKKLVESDYDISPEANVIHGALLIARPDINSVAHVHTIAGTAVSSKASGLKNLSQQSMIVAMSLAYHDYEGIVLDPDEAPRLGSDLGDKTHMILRNHGLLTVGRTVSLTFQALYNLQRSCEMQVASESGGDKLILISDEAIAKTQKIIGAMMANAPPEDLLWEAILRKLRKTEPDFES